MHVSPTERLLPEATPSHSDVLRALDMSVTERLGQILPWLAFFHLWICADAILVGFAREGRTSGWLAFVIGIVCLHLWRLVRQGRFDYGWAQISALSIGTFMLVRTVAVGSRLGEPSQLSEVVLLVLASANTLLKWEGFFYMAAVSALGLFSAVQQELQSAELTDWFWTLLCVIAVSSMGFYLRRSMHYRGHKTRLVEESRKQEAQIKRNRFEVAVQGANDGLWYLDLRSEVFQFSPTWAAMLGYSEHELKSSLDEWMDRVHPGHAADVRKQLLGVVPKFETRV